MATDVISPKTLNNLLWNLTDCCGFTSVLPHGFASIRINDNTVEIEPAENVSRRWMLKQIDELGQPALELPVCAKSCVLISQLYNKTDYVQQEGEFSRTAGFLLHMLRDCAEDQPEKICENGFANPHVWRGDKYVLAFEPAKNVPIGELITTLTTALEADYMDRRGTKRKYTLDTGIAIDYQADFHWVDEDLWHDLLCEIYI